jgi:hypothetical protein
MLFAQLVAAAGFLLPVAIWTWLRLARADAATREGRFALELPLGVALDLLSVLLLSRVFTLATATLISRGAWCLGGGVGAWRWWRAGGRPRRLERAALERLGALALVVLGAVGLSLTLSRPCAIWDREWHIPLVSALRGQRLPFQNVYVPAQELFYHYAGDVQAAMLQTLSGGRMHASLALSLLHDLMFALLALNVVCFLRAAGIRRTALAALAFGAIVMLGPVTLLRDGATRVESGFSLVNYLTLSFRPHVALSYLLQLGFLELVLTPLVDAEALPVLGPLPRAGGLALLAAALVLTDESSLGLLGVGLGALWLAVPSVLGPTRRSGALALVALVATIALSMLMFGGSIGLAAPHYQLSFVAPRAPGYASAPLALATPEGRAALLQDLLPVLGVLAALGFIALRARDRVTSGLMVFYAALTTTSIVALTCLDFEGKAPESHRFATAMFVTAPLVAILALARRPGPGAPRVAPGGLAAIMIYASVGLGVASTIDWLAGGVAYQQCAQPGFYGWGSGAFFDVDCRLEAAAVLGERTVPTYVDLMGFYLWSGCHPIFAPSPQVGPASHHIKTATPWYGGPALDQLRQEVPLPDDELSLVCLSAPAAGPNLDPACARAPRLGPCETRGDFLVCKLKGPARALLSAILNAPPPPPPQLPPRPQPPRPQSPLQPSRPQPPPQPQPPRPQPPRPQSSQGGSPAGTAVRPSSKAK